MPVIRENRFLRVKLDMVTRCQLRDVSENCSVSNMGRPDVLASFSHRAKVRCGNQQPSLGS